MFILVWKVLGKDLMFYKKTRNERLSNVNHFAVGNLLFGQSLRFTECILDTIVF